MKMRRYALGIAMALIIGQAGAAIDILVPAYSNPCCGPMWNGLISAAGNGGFTLDVIFNPASGPGTSVDPNYLKNGKGPLVDVKAAGGVVYGYVATSYGAKSIPAVEAEIDRYFDTLYAGHVDSIFFDEMSNDLTKVGYYQTLRDYVRSKNPSAKVIGNPGTSFVTASGSTAFTVADYAASMDVLVTFENTGSQYLSNYTPPSWVGTLSADHFANIVHTQPTWGDSLVALAAARNAGMLYITDDVMWNPYDQLPSYWNAELAAITAYNMAPIPEPSSLSLLSIGVLGTISYTWHLRRRRATSKVTESFS
jgi:hypothetical protein